MAATAKRADSLPAAVDTAFSPLLRKSNKIEPMLIDSLRESPWQPRLTISPNDLEDLKKSIKDFGFIGYIPVRKSDPDDPMSPLEIVYGHRRVMAARELGMQTVPVMLCQLDDEAMMRLAFVENSTQKKMTYWEEARHLKEMQDRLGLSIRKLSEMIGVSRSYVHSRLNLLNLPEGSPLRLAAEGNEIVMAATVAFANLSRTLEPEQLEHLLDDVRKGELNYVDLQSLERALARSQDLPEGDLTDDGAVIRTSTIEDQTKRTAELVEAARRKELPAVTKEISSSRMAREVAALEKRKQTQDENAAAAEALWNEIEADLPPGPSVDAVGSFLTIKRITDTLIAPAAGLQVDVRQEAAGETPLERVIKATHSTFAQKTGRDYALETIEQLRGVLIHLRPRVEKADFAGLGAAEQEELRAMCSDLVALLPKV